MVILDSQTPERSALAAGGGSGLLGQPPGDLAVCIRGAGRHERIVRVATQKCSIGSDPGCSLALEALGVRPLHCVILQGAVKTIVRRWSPDTRLNGREFTDAYLEAGDRLSVGSLELEILPGEAAPQPASESRNQPEIGNYAEELRQLEREQVERERNWIARCEQREAEFARWDQQLIERREELESQRRALDADRAAFRTEREDWELVQDEARTRLTEKIEHADHRLAELSAERQAHERRKSAWEAQRQNSNDELSRGTQALKAERAAVEAERQSLADAQAVQAAEAETRQRQLGEREQELQRVASQREAEFADKAGELDRQRQALLDERAAWDQERAAHDAEWRDHQAAISAIAAQEAELRSLRDAWEAQRRDWSAQQAAADAERAAREAALAAEAEELARRRTELEAELEAPAPFRGEPDLDGRLAAREQEIEQILVAGEQEVSRLQAELAAERQALEDQRQAWQAEQQERETEFAEREAVLAQRTAAEESSAESRTDVEAGQKALAAEQDAQRRREEVADARLAAREQEIEQILVSSEQELSRLQAELVAERQALDEERRAWQEEVAERQPQTESQSEAWAADRAKLEAELHERELQLAEQRQEIERLAAAGRSQPAADDSYPLAPGPDVEAEAATQNLARQRTELANERQALDEERTLWQEEREREQAELAQDRERLAQERAEWEAEQAELASRSREAVARESHAAGDAEAPGNTADLLSRFRVGAPSDDENADEQERPRQAQEEPGLSARRSEQPAVAAEGGDEEDSIDDYMARLFERIGSKGSAPRSSGESVAARHAAPRPEKPLAAEPEPEAVAMFKDPREMAPRAVRAEQSSDISAMRELANQNARAAIDSHDRRTGRKRGSSKVLTVIVAMTSAALLFWFFLQGREFTLPFVCLSLITALVWAWQFASLRNGRTQAAPTPETRKS